MSEATARRSRADFDPPGGNPPPRPRVRHAPLRIRDLNRAFNARFGTKLPADDSGRRAVDVMLAHMAHLGDGAEKYMDNFLDLRAPWMPPEERSRRKEAAFAANVRWTADELARVIGLKFAERTRLGITTIGSIDVDKAARAEIQKQKNRDRARNKRRQERLRSKPRRASVTERRAAAILAVLPRAKWCSIAALCAELKNDAEFAGADKSMRSAVHRAVQFAEARCMLQTKKEDGGVMKEEMFVARQGVRK